MNARTSLRFALLISLLTALACGGSSEPEQEDTEGGEEPPAPWRCFDYRGADGPTSMCWRDFALCHQTEARARATAGGSVSEACHDEATAWCSETRSHGDVQGHERCTQTAADCQRALDLDVRRGHLEVVRPCQEVNTDQPLTGEPDPETLPDASSRHD